jgi:hypothetical protein
MLHAMPRIDWADGVISPASKVRRIGRPKSQVMRLKRRRVWPPGSRRSPGWATKRLATSNWGIKRPSPASSGPSEAAPRMRKEKMKRIPVPLAVTPKDLAERADKAAGENLDQGLRGSVLD